MSAVTRIMAVMQARSLSMVIMIRAIGIGILARSSLFVSVTIDPCFSDEANTTTQYGLVA